MGTKDCTSPDQLAPLYNRLRQEGLFLDATLVSSDGVKFPVHKVIMACHSQYFQELFSFSSEVEQTFDLEVVTSEQLSALVEFVYTRELAISAATVSGLFFAADYLMLTEARQRCIDFMKGLINPNNCLTLRHFAESHFIESLTKEAQNYLLKHFAQVAETSREILSLPVEELVPILTSDSLNVRNEDIVWRLVLRWIEHEPESRLPYLVHLLKCIRLGLMEVQYFLENVKNHPYIVGNQETRPVIIETLKVLMDVETITEQDGAVQTPECARPRIPHEVLFAIGGWSGGSPTTAIETYDTRADRWITVAEIDPAGPRAYHGTAVIGSNIFVIGGFDGMENFNSCRCFNAETKTWKEISPMHERRCYVSVVVIDNIIYAMGGYNGHHRQNTAEKYNPITNQWSMISPMHVQRSDASATTLNGRIYITGGFDGRECLNSAEMYDPASNTWTLLPPMRSRRSGVSCTAYHGNIYVLGGFNGVARMSSAERYCPETNQWIQVPDMYTTRSNFAIEVIDDMVFAIGGFNGVATIHQVECYDDRTLEWYEATDMNVFRSALSASVVSDLPNLEDYIHQNRDMLMEEKRQRLLAMTLNRPANNNDQPQPPNPNLAHITQALNEAEMQVQIIGNNNENLMDQHEEEEDEQ